MDGILSYLQTFWVIKVGGETCMSMARVIKGVFGVLGCAVLMAILYDLLLAYEPKYLNSAGYGDGTFKDETGKERHGVIWEVAHNIQNPISFYYYNYCYMPNFHQTNGIDSKIGYKLVNNTTGDVVGGMNSTPSDLSGSVDSIQDMVDTSGNKWSTGWK